MDRRSDNEAAVNFSDRHFQQALEVIVGLYDGVSAETLYRDAIGCFESLIEISRNTDLTADFARRHNIDRKYLVDGASFVISKMHFNPESNYYLTLGISRDASSEEIRERWKKLMLLYHPDRQEGKESLVSERAKKVNEAYSILKDSDKRQAFDRRLLGRTPAGKPVIHPVKYERSSVSGSKSTLFSREWDRQRRNIPKVLVGAYILAALVFLGYIYIQNNSDQLESSLSSSSELAVRPQIREVSPAENKDPDNIGIPEPSASGEGIKATESAVPEPSPDAPGKQEKRKTGSSGTAPKAAQAGLSYAPEKPAAADYFAYHKPGVQEKPSDLSTDPPKELPDAGFSTGDSRIAQLQVNGPAPSGQTQIKETPGITHEEVEGFMDRYSRAYLKGDLRAFMALFSKSVLENGRLHYTDLHEAYRITFSEKIEFFRVRNMKITIYGPGADVSGFYEFKRYASDKGRWTLYSGKVQWKIAKEKDELKIISMNYDL